MSAILMKACERRSYATRSTDTRDRTCDVRLRCPSARTLTGLLLTVAALSVVASATGCATRSEPWQPVVALRGGQSGETSAAVTLVGRPTRLLVRVGSDYPRFKMYLLPADWRSSSAAVPVAGEDPYPSRYLIESVETSTSRLILLSQPSGKYTLVVFPFGNHDWSATVEQLVP